MILRFGRALEVSTDELLQPAGPRKLNKPSRKVLRRLEQIEALPAGQQTMLLKTIDYVLQNAAFKAGAEVMTGAIDKGRAALLSTVLSTVVSVVTLIESV